MHRKAINHLRRADPVLERVIARVGPCRFEPRAEGTHFEAIVRAIVYQQLSGSAAFTIHSRLQALFPAGTPDPERLLAIDGAALRAAGLSRQKIGYLRDLARHAVSGEVPFGSLHELHDAAVVEVLTRVKGVGEWTAQMFLMFRLGRPDVLPVLDLGIRKAVQRAYRMRSLPSPERLRRVAAAWSPWSTVACWYLWRSLDVDGASRTPPSRRQGGSTRARRRAR